MGYEDFRQIAAAPRDMKRDTGGCGHLDRDVGAGRSKPEAKINFCQHLQTGSGRSYMYVSTQNVFGYDMYTLAEVTRMCGAKRRSVQLWAEAGALVAMPGTSREGSGVHRVFDRNEALIACILHGLSVQGVTIGKLVTLAGLLRSARHDQFWSETLEDALANRESNFLIYDGNLGMLFWSTKSPTTLEHVLMKMMRSTTLSTICVNLNICLEEARKELVEK
jgi:hypothetical protein